MKHNKLIKLFMIITFLAAFIPFVVHAEGIIQLPQTGQTKCYNSSGTEISCAGTGQDGDPTMGVDWPNPRFTVSGDCVTDNLTGLMWAKNGNLPNGTKTWQGALDYVASINFIAGIGLCGYKDWRLPNINELESLVNAGEANTATWLNSQGFSSVQSDYYWSSTTYAYYTGSAWVVHMWYGYVEDGNKSYSTYVWLVRSGQGSLGYSDISIISNPVSFGSANVGAALEQAALVIDGRTAGEAPAQLWKTGQKTSYATGDDGDLERGVAWPDPRFTDQGDGTVTDNLTGLMWMKNANLAGGTKTWQGALDYVKTLSTGGHFDWRLPNRKELFSLIDRSRYDTALPVDHPFQNVQSDYYWSSTTSGLHPWG
jgi:hypothetical protein